MSAAKIPPPPELDWIKLKQDMEATADLDSASATAEGLWSRVKRKSIEAPLVPVGCLATVAALSYGLYNFRVGNQVMSQYCMRARIAAQGFTIIVAVASTMIATQKRLAENAES